MRTLLVLFTSTLLAQAPQQQLGISQKISGSTAITRITKAFAGGAAGATTAAMNCTGANFYAAAITSLGGSGTLTVSDASGHTFSHITDGSSGAAPFASLYYVGNITGSATETFTVVGSFTLLIAACYSNVNATPLDTQAATILNNCYSCQITSTSPAGNNELFLVAASTQDATGVITVNSSFGTVESKSLSGGVYYGGALFEKIQTTGGAESPTLTDAGATGGATMGIFKP